MKKTQQKYGNRKVVYNGIEFDSVKEKDRYIVLCQSEAVGLISELTLQPKFELIPKITEKFVKHLKTKDKECERTVQLPITYTADFSYIKDGKRVIEDVKASKFMLPKEFTIKAKMMKYFHDIDIRLIYKASESI